MRLFTYLLKNRKSINIKNDIVAGIVVALVSIPISMGYAQIAGLPVIYGLYGSLLPILFFGLLSTSPQFVVGVDAMPAVMVGTVLAELRIVSESDEAMKVVPVMSLLVALWFVVFYLIKAGRVVKYISTPVMGGFISGVGVTIILMQIPKLFGGVTGTGEFFDLIENIYSQISDFNIVSLALGVGTVVIILIFKKTMPKIPMTVLMMIVGAGLEVWLHLEDYGVKLLPSVEPSLPPMVLPDIRLILLEPNLFILESFSIAAVIMAQTLLATGNYAAKYGDKVDNDKELIAYSVMNGISAFTGCPPINGSVSRSGIADSFGARSQIMSLSASFTMLVVILFGTPLLEYLPVPILTGIVMTALIGIVEKKLFIRLWKTNRRECSIFFMSFVGVLLFGTVNGVLIGCALSFADVALQATVPPTAFVGRIPRQGNFYALDRNSEARPIKHVVIYRFSGSLIFANIDKFKSDIENAIKVDTKCVVVDARGIGTVDITSVDRLVTFSKNLRNRGINFYITEHSGHLNDQFRNYGGECLVDEGFVRRTITLALRDAGMEKPYELEDSDGYSELYAEEADERLAEFEWAFGKDAENRLEQMADEAADKITESIHDNTENDISLIDSARLETKWGKLGRFEENEFWDYLEFRLEELYHSGKISEDELTKLERRIEERRISSEDKLQKISPYALKRLKEHREKLRERLRELNPKEYEHMKLLQQQYYEKLKEKNPDLADALKELHDKHKSE